MYKFIGSKNRVNLLFSPVCTEFVFSETISFIEVLLDHLKQLQSDLFIKQSYCFHTYFFLLDHSQN